MTTKNNDEVYSAAAEALFDLFENWADDFSYTYKDRIEEDIERILHVYFKEG
ncbi:MAG: hypothetical protein IJI14_20060 [Anaerolineaceae bacterium]|nr:hypothetical protein [Anaerolineaceae bacterium]